jgi:hypothetical protein
MSLMSLIPILADAMPDASHRESDSQPLSAQRSARQRAAPAANGRRATRPQHPAAACRRRPDTAMVPTITSLLASLLASTPAAAAAAPVYVQFAHNGSCLAAVRSSERSPLKLGPCQASEPPRWLNIWNAAKGALGSPQLAVAGSQASGRGLCLNDDSVRCVAGNDLFLHECQGLDEPVHTANHFSWDAASHQIVAEFCPPTGGKPSFCVVAKPTRIELGACGGAEARWAQEEYRGVLPPAPPSPTPLPPPPPLPPAQPPCKDCPNIVFVLTVRDMRSHLPR